MMKSKFFICSVLLILMLSIIFANLKSNYMIHEEGHSYYKTIFISNQNYDDEEAQSGENIPLHIVMGIIILIGILFFLIYVISNFFEKSKYSLITDVTSNIVRKNQTITIHFKLNEYIPQIEANTPIVQYKDPSRGSIWQMNYISNISWNNHIQEWDTKFSPPSDAEPGLYDFRVKFRGHEGNNYPWVYKWDLVEVVSENIYENSTSTMKGQY